MLVPEALSSPEALSRVCPQLLDAPTWVPPSLRRLAYEACAVWYQSNREPPETRYTTLDGLYHAAWSAL